MKITQVWRVVALTLIAASARAQNCSQPGNVCISPGTVSGPQMPIMAFSVQQSNCSSAQASVELSWTPQYAGPSATSGGAYYSGSEGAFVSPLVYGNGTASIDWTDNFYASYRGADTFEGGTGTAAIYISGYTPVLADLTVFGQNPSYALVAQAMQGMQAPWWYGKALSHESATTQFATYNVGGKNPVTYMPLFGPPDGFGLGQIDGATANPSAVVTDDTLWDWQSNLAEGVGIALSKHQPAYNYFTLQNKTAVSYGYTNPPFASVEYGFCPVMSWYGTGQNGVQDAEWITSYNGGHYITFNPPLSINSSSPSPPITPVQHGGWQAPSVKYITGVCQAQTQTY